MNLNAPVTSIMSKDYIALPPDTCIGKAEKIMNKKGVNLVCVEERGDFQGLLTMQDCMYFRETLTKDGIHGPDEGLRLKHHKVSEIMHTRLVRLSEKDSIRMACEIMKSIIFQVIPVVERSKMKGVLTPQVLRKCVERQTVVSGSC